MKAVGLVVLCVAFGCNPEPGKVRGRTSHGSAAPWATAAPARFLLAAGHGSDAQAVASRVRSRLGARDIDAGRVAILGADVQVDVAADEREVASEALVGGRLDVYAGEELLVRGEYVRRVLASDEGLVLVVEGARKTALARARSSGATLAVKIDGEEVARIAATSDAVQPEQGELVVTMERARARALAEMLSERSLSHRVVYAPRGSE